MCRLNAIFARGTKGEFSLSDGSLPWKNIPELLEDSKKDMSHFKATTMGQIVIMGFNTYRTFDRPLPSRINVAIDRKCTNSDSIKDNQFNFFNSLESALDFFSAKEYAGKKLFLIGGAKLLKTALEKNLITGKIYETIFNWSFPEAAAFINPLTEEWKIVSKEMLGENSCLLCREKK